jgi:hypothetical protein
VSPLLVEYLEIVSTFSIYNSSWEAVFFASPFRLPLREKGSRKARILSYLRGPVFDGKKRELQPRTKKGRRQRTLVLLHFAAIDDEKSRKRLDTESLVSVFANLRISSGEEVDGAAEVGREGFVKGSHFPGGCEEQGHRLGGGLKMGVREKKARVEGRKEWAHLLPESLNLLGGTSGLDEGRHAGSEVSDDVLGLARSIVAWRQGVRIRGE